MANELDPTTGPSVRVSGPARTTSGHVVTIQLTEEQQSALKELSGEDVSELSIVVEDLADIADLMTN